MHDIIMSGIVPSKYLDFSLGYISHSQVMNNLRSCISLLEETQNLSSASERFCLMLLIFFFRNWTSPITAIPFLLFDSRYQAHIKYNVNSVGVTLSSQLHFLYRYFATVSHKVKDYRSQGIISWYTF